MPAQSRTDLHRIVHDLHENDVVLHPPPPRQWLDRAACVDVAISVFYPDDSGDVMEALLICGSCPVRAECLQYAVGARETYGLWGGTTPEQPPECDRLGPGGLVEPRVETVWLQNRLQTRAGCPSWSPVRIRRHSLMR